MKYKKYIKFFIAKPTIEYLHYKLNLLLPDFEFDLDVFYCILNDLSQIKYHKKTENDNQFIPMYSGLLKEKYGNEYFKYMRYLLNNSIITRTPYYSIGKCRYYKIVDSIAYRVEMVSYNPTYSLLNKEKYNVIPSIDKGIEGNQKLGNLTDIVEIKIDITSTIGKMITGYYKRELDRIKKYPEHIKEMSRYMKENLELEVTMAKQYIIDKFKKDLELANGNQDLIISAQNAYDQRIRSILQIGDKSTPRKLRFNRNGTNKRLDTDLTNMAGDLRQFMKGYNQMSYLDLSNSQPVLFNIMLKKYSAKANTKMLMEIIDYSDMTLSGQWYEYLIAIFKINTGDAKNDRDIAKGLWMDIAYSKNTSWRGKKKVFARDFSEIMRLIESYKVMNHGDFSVELQKIESEIFIDQICKELVEAEIIPYSLHDGVLVSKDKEEETYQIMAKVLKANLGMVPVIAINGVKRYLEGQKPIKYKRPNNYTGMDYIRMGEIRRTKTHNKIFRVLDKWDTRTQGEPNAKNIALHTGITKKTVEKHLKDFTEKIQVLNGTDPESLARKAAFAKAHPLLAMLDDNGNLK